MASKQEAQRLWPYNIEGIDNFGERAGPGKKQPKTEANSTKNPSEKKRPSGGRPPKYDWDEVEMFVFQTLDDRGDFAHPKNQVAGWRSQADLIRLAHERFKAQYEKANPSAVDAEEQLPKESTWKERIRPMIAKWRESQAGKADN